MRQRSPARPSLHAVIACLLLAAASTAGATDLQSIGVSAFVPSKSNCRFTTNWQAMNFGNIDPSQTIAYTATSQATINCQGSAGMAVYALNAGNGLYSTGVGARRMRHATNTTEFLPYSLSLSPSSGSIPKGVDQVITATGTVLASSYQNAAAGLYQDTVSITLTP